MKLADTDAVRLLGAVRHSKMHVRDHLMNPHCVLRAAPDNDEGWPFMLTLSEYPHIRAALLEIVEAEIARTNDELRRLGVDPE